MKNRIPGSILLSAWALTSSIAACGPSVPSPTSSAAAAGSGGASSSGSAGRSDTSSGGASAGMSSGASGAANSGDVGGRSESGGGAAPGGAAGAMAGGQSFAGQSFAGTAGANAAGSTQGGAAGSSMGGSSAAGAGGGGPWHFPSGVTKPRIMIVGDSISAGPGCYKKYLLQALTDNHYSNFQFVGEYSDDCGGVVRHSAVSCSTAEQYTHDTFMMSNCSVGTTFKGLSGLMTSQKPDLVMLQLGVNDVWGNQSVNAILASYTTLVQQARAANPSRRTSGGADSKDPSELRQRCRR